jgi:hypothetical protein
VNNELKRMRKEEVMAKFQVSFRNLPGGNEVKHENHQSG